MAQKRLIHRYWSGPKDMPEDYVRYGQKWEDLNPGWMVIDHGEEVIQLWPELYAVFNHLYERDNGKDSIELHVQVADIVGYALVAEFGGMYVNCDMEPISPIADKLPEAPWASYENTEDWRIVNAAIGAPEAGDPFWLDLLKGLPDNYFYNPYDEMVMTTGPGYLTQKVGECLSRGGAFHVFPQETFNSVHWKQVPEGGNADGFEVPADAIAVHHWGHRKDGRSNLIELGEDTRATT